MAILHRATIEPTKPEIVADWLDRQPWGRSGTVDVIGSYRFDDPEGAVGVESMLIRREATVLQVPMTYRGAPLAGAESHLITTMRHSVLGERWVYEAEGDPVAMACFARALSGEQEQALLELHDGDGSVVRREPAVTVRRRISTGRAAGDLRLAQVLDGDLAGHEELVAVWDGGEAVVAAR